MECAFEANHHKDNDVSWTVVRNGFWGRGEKITKINRSLNLT